MDFSNCNNRKIQLTQLFLFHILLVPAGCSCSSLSAPLAHSFFQTHCCFLLKYFTNFWIAFFACFLIFVHLFCFCFFVFLLTACQAAVYLLPRLLLDNPFLFFFQCCSGHLPDKRSFSCAWNLCLCTHDTVCSLFPPQLI